MEQGGREGRGRCLRHHKPRYLLSRLWQVLDTVVCVVALKALLRVLDTEHGWSDHRGIVVMGLPPPLWAPAVRRTGVGSVAWSSLQGVDDDWAQTASKQRGNTFFNFGG